MTKTIICNDDDCFTWRHRIRHFSLFIKLLFPPFLSSLPLSLCSSLSLPTLSRARSRVDCGNSAHSISDPRCQNFGLTRHTQIFWHYVQSFFYFPVYFVCACASFLKCIKKLKNALNGTKETTTLVPRSLLLWHDGSLKVENAINAK